MRTSSLQKTGQIATHLLDTVPIASGGTGAVSAAQAAVALGLETYHNANSRNRAVVLDSNGEVDKSLLSANVGSKEHALVGPTSMVANIANIYTVTDYDSFDEYSIVATNASVSRVNNVLTIVPTIGASEVVLRINTREYTIPVSNASSIKPTITQPTAGYASVGNSYVFRSSDYVAPSTGITHLNSDWEIALDMNFSKVVFSSYASSSNKTTWPVAGLIANTTYFVRVRHRNSDNSVTNWSTSVLFSTKATFVPTTLAQTIGSLGLSDVNDNIGVSMALSEDGTVLVMGTAPIMSNNGPKAFIYERVNGVWVHKLTLKTTAKFNTTYEWKADSKLYAVKVAVSKDGLHVAAIFPGVEGTTLDTTRFTAITARNTGGVWAETQTITDHSLVSTQPIVDVALNQDGSTMVLGLAGVGVFSALGVGQVHVYKRGTTWNKSQTINIPDTRVSTNSNTDGDTILFGASVDISADGRYLAIGAPGRSKDVSGNSLGYRGVVYLYALSGSSYVNTWDSRGKALSEPVAQRGWNVRLTDTGTKLFISKTLYAGTAGTPSQNSDGGCEVFEIATSTSLNYLTALLPGGWLYGTAMGMDISGDGSQVIVGSPMSDGSYQNQGSVSRYVLSNGSYSLGTIDGVGSLYQEGQRGSALALSSDGMVAAIGQPMVNRAGNTIARSTPALLSSDGKTTLPQTIAIDTTAITGALVTPISVLKSGPLTLQAVENGLNANGEPSFPLSHTFAAGVLNTDLSRNCGFPSTISVPFSASALIASLKLNNVQKIAVNGGYAYRALYIWLDHLRWVLELNPIVNMTNYSSVTYTLSSQDTTLTDGLKTMTFTPTIDSNLSDLLLGDVRYSYNLTNVANSSYPSRGQILMMA